MIRTVFSIATSRLMWSGLGITALCLLIWTVGPLVAIGDYRPLESSLYRYIAIAVLYTLWISYRVVPRLWRRWQNRRLVQRMAPATTETAENDDMSAEHPLAERFSEATQLLRQARFNRPESRRWPRWMQKLNRQYLYQLPWYMLIGAPGAGKTTALVNSGLHFPLAAQFGKTALRGVGGTRHCDWWFTDEAILLDTAGRYTTQESDRQQDAQEWRSFMGLLKKYRPRQPVNGAIITISVGDLLSESEEARYQQASALRKRLLELRDQLAIPFPVYVLVTKTDLLKGFTASFGAMNKAQRDQIWGFTWPWSDQQLAVGSEFEPQFDRLHQRLDAGLADLMINEHDSVKRAEMYLFPQEFLALKPLLKHYLDVVFATSGYDAKLIPRGVYFTSGTQEGLPFDRVMGQMSRALGLPALRAANAEPAQPGHGQSFFLHQMLTEVVFKEAGLAGINRWWAMRNRMVHLIAYAVLVLLLILALIGWFTSYHHNKGYLAEVQQRVPDIEKQSKALSPLNGENLFSLLPFLNSLAGLPSSDKLADVQQPPLSWRAGLYRGEEVSTASDSLYQRALEQMLLPVIARNITDWLRSDNGSDVDYSYEALKAYQMLYLPQHYDGKFLHAWVMLNVQRTQGANAPQAQLKALDYHLSQLLDDKINASPFERDEPLVVRQIEMISRSPLSTRVYGRLKRLLMPRVNPGVSLINLSGAQTELVLSRKSGKPLTEAIPGFFTPAGYWGPFNNNIKNVAASLLQEDHWVLTRRESADDQNTLEETVRRLYLDDYMRVWDALLQDIQLQPINNLGERINSARLLSGRTSPLRQLMINLGRNLTLTPPEDEKAKQNQPSLLERSTHYVNNNATATLQALFRARKAAQSGTLEAPEQRVMAHFASIIEQAQVSDPKESSIPFDAQLKDIDDLYSYLTAVQDASNSGMSPPDSSIISRMQADAGRQPEPFRTLLLELAVGASSDTQKRTMSNMQKRAGVEVGSFCRSAIAGRYPFNRSSGTDITPDDLARMFAPGTGLMDSFFRDNLASKVDTTHSSWRYAPGVDGKTLPGGTTLLRPFQQAQAIREALFANGASTPSYRLTITPISMDNSILNLTLDVDGQLIRYSHGPQTPQVVNWPGSGNTQQVRMQIGLTDGTTNTLNTSGPWALNRLFDKASLRPGTSQSQQATFNLGGHQVVLAYTPNSVRNPLQLPGFSCP
ncbi:type VI secretion system membrane subunit TssM [Type-D symbiont of Plautia stali]|uniref:type VI secretion system membrane subunit TssM n=1 Tax=Type-D symbiont of Plautia stali TaxID=1560356 RepID=UPI00073EE0E3|nr:type VI secretion system membrane subunit TssM [Type-D symbiont of Plautia stali]